MVAGSIPPQQQWCFCKLTPGFIEVYPARPDETSKADEVLKTG
jgi:hypothetical protein